MKKKIKTSKETEGFACLTSFHKLVSCQDKKNHVDLWKGTSLGVCGFSACGYIMYLFYHVVLHEYYIKGSCKFMGGSSLWYVISLLSMVTIVYGWKPLTVS